MSSLRLKPFEYYEPDDTNEATELLAAWGAEAQVLAGGVDLIPRMRSGSVEARYVVNIQPIPGLDAIESGASGLRFGAMARLHDLEKTPSVNSSYPALFDAVHQITSVQTKCMGTAVGNICAATPASDVAVALMALDAVVEVVGPNGTRDIPMAEFYEGYRRLALKRGEMVVGVSVPAPPLGSGAAFMNLVRTHADIAKVTVAVALQTDGGRCTAARVAVGSVAPVTIRAMEAEAVLTGQTMDPQTVAKAAEAAAAATRPITDVRSTAEYRREMTAVLVSRALAKAAARAKVV
jgi:carbon-monoxide dehydrogenase medium subunit